MTNNYLADKVIAPPSAPAKPAGPVPNPGIRQIDGNQSTLGLKPARAPLASREGSPSNGRSGMEGAMGALADKLHPRKGR